MNLPGEGWRIAVNAKITDHLRLSQHDWIWAFKGRTHIKAGEANGSLSGYVKEVDLSWGQRNIIEGNFPDLSSAKSILSTRREGNSTSVTKRLEVTSMRKLTGLRAWLKGMSRKLNGLQVRNDLNSYPSFLTTLICTFNQVGTGKGKRTYWLDPLLRLKNRTSPDRKINKQVHFSRVEKHRQRHWGIRCGQVKQPMWWGRDAEWVKRSGVGNAKVALGRVQSRHMADSVQFSSVSQSCLTLCDPMNHSTPGFSVHHQLPEFTQTHVDWVSDAIQTSHPLLSTSPPALNLSQHQGLFKWVNSLHQVAKVLEFQLQHQSF